MRRKFIKREEWQKNIIPEEGVTFMDSSPVSEISLPPKTVATAIHGNLTARNVQGTIYVIREDSNDTVLLNIDEYSFSAQPDEEKSEVKGPLKTEYHWTDDIPSFLKIQAPKRVIDRIQQIFKRKSGKF